MSEELNNNKETLKRLSGCDVELVDIPPIIKSQIGFDSVMFKFSKQAKTVNLIVPSESAHLNHETEGFVFGIRQIFSVLESGNKNEIMKLKSELRGNELWPEILWPVSIFIDTETNRIIIMRNMFLVTEYDECLSLLVEELKKIEGVIKVEARKRPEDKDNDMYFITCHIHESLYPGTSNFLIDCHPDITSHEWTIKNVIDVIQINKIRETNRLIDDTQHFNEEIHTQQ